MAEAGSRGGDSDEDGDNDELLREWSKRLVKWVLLAGHGPAGGNATVPAWAPAVPPLHPAACRSRAQLAAPAMVE